MGFLIFGAYPNCYDVDDGDYDQTPLYLDIVLNVLDVALRIIFELYNLLSCQAIHDSSEEACIISCEGTVTIQNNLASRRIASHIGNSRMIIACKNTD